MGRSSRRIAAFLAGLSPDEAETIENLVVRKRFAKGKVVLFEEDTCNYMYFIFSGRVRVVQLSSDGKERILAIHKKGEYFGELSLLDGKTSPATVIAMEDSEIGLLAKSDFDRVLRHNEKILQGVMGTLCSRLRESWTIIRVMSFADAEERVRAVLRSMCRNYGVKDQRGVLITLKLTHRDIASYANVSRETVTRLLSRYNREGLLEILDNGCILVKPSFSAK